VLALAPDAGSTSSARSLASPGRWRSFGCCEQPAALWGECAGSGKNPYLATVDLAGPAYQCSCPSRKFPCKHALALLLLWSAGAVPEAAAPERVRSWLGSRADRAERSKARAGTSGTADGEQPGPADPEAARRRAEQRDRRMAAGLAELRQWLTDQVRTGLAGTERSGYQLFDGLAARMVDAQVPGVAATARRLASVAVSGEGWHERLLEEYGLLHLLAVAGREPAVAGEPVRSHLGLTTGKEEVLATPPVRDEWAVLGLRDTAEDRLTSRRVWLRGTATGRMALVLSFAVTGQALDASLVPGTRVEADLHFYPAAAPLRALVGTRHAVPRQAGAVPGVGLDGALREWAQALAADPWTRSWPVTLTGVVPVPEAIGWWLVEPGPDGGGRSLPVLDPGDGGWVLLAVSGGHPVDLLVELVPGGARLVSVLPGAEHELVVL
jgi:hypothetical protein